MTSSSSATTVPAEVVFGAVARKQTPLWKMLLSPVLRSRMGAIGAFFVLLLILTAVSAPLLAPYSPIEPDYSAALKPPNAAHLFGTDNLGRDLLSRVIWGAVISLQVVLAVPLAIAVGVPFGLIAAQARGTVDAVIMRTADAMMTVPTIFLALALLAALGPGISNVVIAIAIADMPRFARIARAQALSVSQQEYITAARALGVSSYRIVWRHVWPNSVDPIIVQASLLTGSAILLEAGLSFLGVGVQPPTPTWGSMIKIGYQFLQTAPWVPIAAGVAIFLAVLGFNFLGDAVRDSLDPKLRNR